jgi:4-hydroxy-tetrahydrodipicolinate synthase
MLRGSIVALVTPFGADGTIDWEAYASLIEWQIRQGTDGIVPCGCTGEAATLSHDEQEQVIRFAVEKVSSRITVIAGAGSNNTSEAIRLTRAAKQAGANGALHIMPYYNKPTLAGQLAHYQAIAQAVPGFPLVLYNVPTRTGRELDLGVVLELAKDPSFAAIKEAGGSVDRVSQIIASGADITVLSGDDSLTLPMMSVGAKGVISVAANVVPAKIRQLCEFANAGRLSEARELHLELFPLFKALFTETNPMPVKAALAHMGLIENVLRLPLVPMTNAMFDHHLRPVLQALNVELVN